MRIFILLLTTLLTHTHLSAQNDGPWTLQRCIDEAFQKNIQIKQSELQVEFAEINQLQNTGAFLPSINGSATHGYNWGQTIDPFTNTFATERIRSNSIGLGTGLVLFNGFQLLNTYKQGNIEIEVQKANLAKMQNDIALNVANAFLNVLFQEEFVTAAQANVNNTLQQVQRVENMVNAGAAPEGQLLEIKSQLANDEAALVRSTNGLNMAYLNLRQLLLIPDSEADDFVISRPPADAVEEIKLPGSTQAAVSSALNSFPEVKSANASLQSSLVGRKIAQGNLYPRLNVSYSYGSGFSGARVVPSGELMPAGTIPVGFVEGTNQLVVAPNFEYSGGFETKEFNAQIRDNVNQSLFFNLTIPIFNGFSTRSSIRRAEVSVKNAEYNLELTKQQLRNAVELAWADALAALNSYRAAEQSVEAAELAFKYAEIRFSEGASNIADFSAARARVDVARTDLIRSKYDYIFRVKVVEFYMGQPLTLR